MDRCVKIATLIFGLIFSDITFGHSQEYIAWKFAATRMSGAEVTVHAYATVAAGWHLYSQHLGDGGPQPTEFVFEEPKGLKLVGAMEETGKKTQYYDSVYNMEIILFSGVVSFCQRVEVAPTTKIVSGYVQFMICDDHLCVPGREEFNIDINH